MRSCSAEDPILSESQMSSRIRALDWSRTPLGEMSGWSAELLSAVNTMLCSPLPALIYWGLDLTLLYNDPAIEIADGKHPACLGSPAAEVWQEAWHLIGKEVEQVCRSGKGVLQEGKRVDLNKGGALVEMYWNYVYMPLYEAGKIAGCLLMCKEVTESYKMAQHLEARDVYLSSMVGELSQVMAATTDAIVCVNREWRFTYLNPRGVAIYASDRDVLGKGLWEEFPEAYYPGSPYVEHYERAMYQKVTATFEAFYPEPLNIWSRISVFPTDDGIVTFARDITDEKHTAAALIQSEKLAVVGRMASSIAHEINNPLAAVMNLLYLAQSAQDPTEIRTHLDSADEELRRVAVIANQTLRFHKQSSSPRDITCQELFSSVLNMLQSKLRNSNIVVEKRRWANKPVRIYEGDIRQVIANVIGNAIDAMPGGGRLIVRSREGTQIHSGAASLVLTIADTGCGIPSEKIAKVFDAFYSTKGIGGTGLGLWISNEIMHRHGGSIRIRSRQDVRGSGTVVTLFLPYLRAPGPKRVEAVCSDSQAGDRSREANVA